MTFPSLRLPAILPAGSTPLWVAGNCEAGWRTTIARLAFSFGSLHACASCAERRVVDRLPGAGAKQIRGLIHADADPCQDLRRRFSKTNPRHSKASVVMIDHHTGKFGNAKTEFGIA